MNLLRLLYLNPSVSLGLAICLALFTLAHYGQTALTRPWLVLKAMLFAAIAHGLALTTTDLNGWLVSLAVFSVSFCIIGETDIGRTALQNSASPASVGRGQPTRQTTLFELARSNYARKDPTIVTLLDGRNDGLPAARHAHTETMTVNHMVPPDPLGTSRLATHEAGHAVLGRYFGWQVCCVHLYTSDSYGLTSFVQRDDDNRHTAMVALAGAIAEELHLPRGELGDWSKDRAEAEKAIAKIHPDDAAAQKHLFEQLREEVVALMRTEQNRCAVSAVVDAFSNSAILRGDLVEQRIDQAWRQLALNRSS